MNIYVAASLFSVLILLYWIISEVFTMLFRLIGLPEEKARFQVTSLLTGCGFTTHESEMILSSKPRRRLARITMLFGYVFNVTIVSALVNFFVSMKIDMFQGTFFSLLIPMAAAVAVIVLSRIGAVRNWLDRHVERFVAKLSGSSGLNNVVLIDQIGKSAIAQVTFKTIPEFLQDVTLDKSGLKPKFNILVMLIERGGVKAVLPTAKTVFEVGDRITVYGNYQQICKILNAKEHFSDD